MTFHDTDNDDGVLQSVGMELLDALKVSKKVSINDEKFKGLEDITSNIQKITTETLSKAYDVKFEKQVKELFKGDKQQ